MKPRRALTQAEVDQLTDDQLAVMEKSTQQLANEMQRQAAAYQRDADRFRKNLKLRKREAA